MTTSLPTTTTEPNPGNGGSGVSSPLSADLAALFVANPAAGDASAPTTPLNFGAMLSGSNGEATANPTPRPALGGATTLPREPLPGVVNCTTTRPTDARVVATSAAPRAAISAPRAADAAAPDRNTIESALALVLPLLGLQTDTPLVPTATPTGEGAAPAAFPSASSASPGTPSTASTQGAGAQVEFTAAGAQPVQVAVPAGLASEKLGAEISRALAPEESEASGIDSRPNPSGIAVATKSAAAPTPVALDRAENVGESTAPVALAAPLAPGARGAGESLARPQRLPQTELANLSSDESSAAEQLLPRDTAPLTHAPEFASAEAADGFAPQAEAATADLVATVELADGSVVRVTLPTVAREPSAAGAQTPIAAQAENSAAGAPRAGGRMATTENDFGKNFLNAQEEEVSLPRGGAGIGVAQEPTPMFTPPHAALPAASPTETAHVAFVAPTAVATERAPMPELTAVSIAHRAVDAVTSVVEAQAASKLQPVPSVQLKFRVGTDDLAVRVEYRGGVVRAEFRTDSPELRAAIDQEWQAVTGQAASNLRYADPVFTTSNGAQSGTPSFAQGNPQHSSAQQQQQQQQSQQNARAAAEFFGSVARSTPYQPREGGVATSSVAPLIAPTSHHLSAVA